MNKLKFPRVEMKIKYWLKHYKEPSLYDQHIDKLSCKIFNEFHKEQIPENLARNDDINIKYPWIYRNQEKLNTYYRMSFLPIDLDDTVNEKYYPPHPQIKKFTQILRDYGLFRNEHQDFIDEMKRARELRGKKKVWKRREQNKKENS